MPVAPSIYQADGFVGMRQSVSGLTPPGHLWYAENLFPVDGVLYSRPGIDGDGAGGGATVGTTGSAQLAYRFVTASGGEILLHIVNGELYSHTTRVITAAQLTTASITLSSTARCYLTALNGKVIITDGTNTPFQWDGTAGGGLTSLTNCPVLYGRPVTYYGKVFGIKNTDRRTIVWSEENDATLGYETAPYSNAWTLFQSGDDVLWALGATNEALYYWRSGAIGRVTGAVGADFSVAGTRDDVTTDIGSTAPAGPLLAGQAFWFWDEQGRTWVLPLGGAPIPLWEQSPAFFSPGSSNPPYQATSTLLGGYWRSFAAAGVYAEYWQDRDAVVMCMIQATTNRLLALVYRKSDYQLLGVLTVEAAADVGASMELAGLHTNSNLGVTFLTRTRGMGLLRELVLGERTTLAADNLGGTATNPVVRCMTGKLGPNGADDFRFTTLSLEAVRDGSNVSTFGLQYLTSQTRLMASLSTAQTVAPTVDSTQRKSVGIDGYGRWLAAAVTVNYLSANNRAQTRIARLSLEAYRDAVEYANV